LAAAYSLIALEQPTALLPFSSPQSCCFGAAYSLVAWQHPKPCYLSAAHSLVALEQPTVLLLGSTLSLVPWQLIKNYNNIKKLNFFDPLETRWVLAAGWFKAWTV
jgi:hypothetical protein